MKNIKIICLKNHWGNYYLVEFENLDDAKNFSLILQNQESNKGDTKLCKIVDSEILFSLFR